MSQPVGDIEAAPTVATRYAVTPASRYRSAPAGHTVIRSETVLRADGSVLRHTTVAIETFVDVARARALCTRLRAACALGAEADALAAAEEAAA